MNMKINLLRHIPPSFNEETFQTLLKQDGVRIERIVSHGQCSPPGFWYDQNEGEWVLLLSGAARLRLADPEEMVELAMGEAFNIAAHRRHRVEWTAPDQLTIWLAVFYGGGPPIYDPDGAALPSCPAADSTPT